MLLPNQTQATLKCFASRRFPTPPLIGAEAPAPAINIVVNKKTFSEHCDSLHPPNPVFGSIMVALVVIGLIGNSLVFFTILVLHEYKKSVTNWSVKSLKKHEYINKI